MACSSMARVGCLLVRRRSSPWHKRCPPAPVGRIPTPPMAGSIRRANRTSAWFEWGTTTNFGNRTPVRSLGSGTSNTNLSEVLPDVIVGITYYFRAVASNSLGMLFGGEQSFTDRQWTGVGGDNLF